ncbi:MAG TPA: EAL domain-containing protein, partial [Sphingomicrobium sp.]
MALTAKYQVAVSLLYMASSSTAWFKPTRSWVLGGLAIVAVIAAWTVGLAAPLVCLFAIGVAFDRIRTHRALSIFAHHLESATGSAATGGSLRRLETAVGEASARLQSVVSRTGQRHSMSGLPTREPLLEKIAEDGWGSLGIIALVDFDRLCAFDPALGDDVLMTTAARLRRMVSSRTLVAQVDRATFAIWSGRQLADEGAGAQLEAIGYALGDAIAMDDRTIRPEIRVRQSNFTEGDNDPQALLTRTIASVALNAGAEEASPTDTAAAARDHYAFEQDVRQAIDGQQFHLSYQPLIDAVEGRVCGAEALLRWNHPERGPVSPAQFVPVAEALGLSNDLGMWALNGAIREARAWQRDNLAGLSVAVNVSGYQLDRDDLCRLVERTLARHSLGADSLEIELTESVAMGNSARAAQLLGSLRDLGVRLAIDDFGTGFSSLSTLRTLSFDKIKIDREFVTNVDKQSDCQAICQSVIALGRGLGIRVLAEGVERREEYEWLRRHGCSHFQGYYFSQPLA